MNDEPSGDSLVGDAHVLPGVHLTYEDGLQLKAWLASGSDHMAGITGMEVDIAPENGDVMASFSSRGPNPSVRDLIKPDVTAPGVDILAAFNLDVTDPTGPPAYGVISGTSMSSPHTAGAAALLRALRPEWSPDEVRSALVTTGVTDGVRKEDGTTAADPFDMGGGRVDLTQAGRAGLVLDETIENYDAANPSEGGEPSALNLPTLAHGDCAGVCSWTRVVKSSADGEVTWTASVEAPAGLALSVEPASFELAPGETRTLTITADVSGLSEERWHFGRVVLEPSGEGVPQAHLTVGVVPADAGSFEPVTLWFHGNEKDGCTGAGAADIDECDGPFLRDDPELDSAPAAVWGPVTTGLDCTIDRCIADPNWVWWLDEEVTLEGPMTVEWWYQCSSCNLLLFDDFFIRLWADGEQVFEERVRHNVAAGVTTKLRNTVTIPEITASEKLVLHIDPIFVNQNGSVIFYDSTQACPGTTQGPCDSLVRVPVVSTDAPALPDLVVADASASNNRARQGEKVTLHATIANTGDAEAAASTTTFVHESGTVLGSVATPAIPAGGTATVSTHWDTRGAGNGEHVITITADAEGVVAESNEDNNTGTLTLTVRGNKVQNSSFEQSSDGSSPDHWTASGSGTSYDGESVSAGPLGSWTSDAIDVVAGRSYDLVVASTGAAGVVVVQHLTAAGALLGSVSLPALGTLDETVTVPAGAAQVRIVLRGGLAGTTFHDAGLYEE